MAIWTTIRDGRRIAGAASLAAASLVACGGGNGPAAGEGNRPTTLWPPLAPFFEGFEGEFTVPLDVAEYPVGGAHSFLLLMKHNAELFSGKSVLDIGSGSGIIGLYAATLGARTVVATDVDPAAVEATRRNAEALGFADMTEVRLVPASDMSAYSVIRPDERFDVILSHPPFFLDLDAAEPSNFSDPGDLGLSTVRGLDDHLTPDGLAILRHGSVFYFNTVVKFARHMGYEVRSHHPLHFLPLELEIIFNYYAARLLEREDVDPNAVRFNRREDLGLNWRLMGGDLDATRLDYEPLLPGRGRNIYRDGFIVIRRAGAAGRTEAAERDPREDRPASRAGADGGS